MSVVDTQLTASTTTTTSFAQTTSMGPNRAPDGRFAPSRNLADWIAPNIACKGKWQRFPDKTDEENTYLMMQDDGHMEILDRKEVHGEFHYRIKWGSADSENNFHVTWEPRSKLTMCDTILAKFDANPVGRHL